MRVHDGGGHVIEADISIGDDFADAFSEDYNRVRRRMARRVGREIRAHWVRLVEREVGGATAQIYVEAIGQPVIDGDRVTVELDEDHHPAVRMVESGMRPQDLKRALLNSPSAKISKDGGRYIDIPFVHQDPRMATARRTFPSELIPEFRAAQGRDMIVDRGADSAYAGLRKDPVVGQHKGVLRFWKKERGTPVHRFQGVQFRRVSERSEGWITPGMSAHRFADRVEREVTQVVDSALDRELAQALGQR